MVYVGKKGAGEEVDDMRIPPKYSGSAFGADGEPRPYDPDGEALRHAEELFRRGYVFEDRKIEPPPEAVNTAEAERVAESVKEEPVHTAARAENTPPESVKSSAPGTDRGAAPASSAGRERGILAELFGRITTDEILIGAIILILALNGTDDSLLIMLVILLFC